MTQVEIDIIGRITACALKVFNVHGSQSGPAHRYRILLHLIKNLGLDYKIKSERIDTNNSCSVGRFISIEIEGKEYKLPSVPSAASDSLEIKEN